MDSKCPVCKDGSLTAVPKPKVFGKLPVPLVYTIIFAVFAVAMLVMGGYNLALFGIIATAVSLLMAFANKLVCPKCSASFDQRWAGGNYRLSTGSYINWPNLIIIVSCTISFIALSAIYTSTHQPERSQQTRQQASTESPQYQEASDIDSADVLLQRAREYSYSRGHDYTLGETFRLGDFSYRFTYVGRTSRVGKSFVRKHATEGATFLVVHYSETNQGRGTATGLASANIKLHDEQERAFSPSSEAMTALGLSGQADLIVSELHPGVQRKAIVAFEVPVEIASGTLILVLRERGLFSRGRKRILLQP